MTDEELEKWVEKKDREFENRFRKVEVNVGRTTRYLARIAKAVEEASCTIKAYGSRMEEVAKVVSFAEETLMNVLIAIRQNEYLHALYPAQNGKPEQEVVGRYVR
jgi:hypothetical protein